MNRDQNKWHLKAALACCYLLAVFLSPWFHLHPGEDHQNASGDIYHSHAEPFDSHSSGDDERKEHDNPFPHFTEIDNPHNNSLSGQSKLGWITQLHPQQHCRQPETVCQNRPTWSPLFHFVIPPHPREWYVQFATNLSPPRA